MIRLSKGFYIHYTVFVLFLVSFLFGTWKITFMAFLTAFCHELCHLFTALSLKEKCKGIAVMPYGCRLFTAKSKSPLKELLIALSGPLFNIIIALILKRGPLFDINFAMALINLFPIMPLDGGRILNVLLVFVTGPFKAVAVMKSISLFGGGLLAVAGVFQAILTGFNLSFFTAGAFLLFSAITQGGREDIYAGILTGENKLDDGAKQGRVIVARESLPARKILSFFPPGKYAVVKVVDNKGRIKKELTEDDVIGGIMGKGAGIRLYEIT